MRNVVFVFQVIDACFLSHCISKILLFSLVIHDYITC